MKKILSFILCLILLISTGISAAAAPGTAAGTVDERLKAITLSVKDTLGIGDSFTSFTGTVNEYGTASIWALNWSSEKEQLSVTANENGTIVSFNNYVSSVTIPSGGRIPRFPKITLDEAKAAAQLFLGKVLDTSFETVALQGNSSLDYSGSAAYYLNGTLKLYGTETPVNINITVSPDTKKVTSFYRNDLGLDYSSVTKPAAATDKAAASAALKSTLNMKMTYALPGDGSHTAQLQYLPYPGGNFVVDAATGQLIDLSKLDYSSPVPFPGGKGAADAAAGNMSTGSTLTTVEQSTIDKMQGVLSKNALENIVRSFPELGLTADFTVQYINYYTYDDENKATHVIAAFTFAFTPKDATAQYKYITMDAKLGKLISVGGGRVYTDTKTPASEMKYTAQQTEAVARTFAAKILPDELKQTKLDASAGSTADSIHTYIFYRTHDSINFPENYISVGVDAQTGYIVSFYSNWYTYDVTFVASSGAISADTAAAKFSAGVGTALKYVSVPVSTHTSGLLLAYTRSDTSIWGVNALTGELLKSTAGTENALTYNDIDGSPYVSLIKQLASYGVGFPGGAFKPNELLTQLDALILIESTNGRTPIPLVTDSMTASASATGGKIAPPTSSSEIDNIYSMAYSLGILTPAEREPAKLISRAELSKYLVSALGYGDVAKLSGIFKSGFTDDTAIPAPLVGYVAIAKGLGIIRGDQNGRFKPNDTATRLQAAIMVYNCLSRT